jgi:DedD protein
MASPASPEASEIRRRGRQRLIGAIAIAVLLVVFVPMILDSEPHSSRTTPALEIPSKVDAPALPAPSPPRAGVTPPAAAPAEPKATTSTPDKAAPGAPDKAASTGAAPAATTAPAAQATPPLEGFAVQVGAFKDEDKLKQAGELTRLRAGPFPTREAADKALAAVRAASLDGQVVPLP